MTFDPHKYTQPQLDLIQHMTTQFIKVPELINLTTEAICLATPHINTAPQE